MFTLLRKAQPNYVYMKLQFTLSPETNLEQEPEQTAAVLVTNLESGYTWQTQLVYAVFLILSGFKNIEKNQRLTDCSSPNSLFARDQSESFEGFFPIDQIVFQQLRCAPYNLDRLPDYEIHQDQRARIPIGIGDKKLWLAVLNEDDMTKLGKHKMRKGDVSLQLSAN